MTPPELLKLFEKIKLKYPDLYRHLVGLVKALEL